MNTTVCWAEAKTNTDDQMTDLTGNPIDVAEAGQGARFHLAGKTAGSGHYITLKAYADDQLIDQVNISDWYPGEWFYDFLFIQNQESELTVSAQFSWNGGYQVKSTFMILQPADELWIKAQGQVSGDITLHQMLQENS